MIRIAPFSYCPFFQIELRKCTCIREMPGWWLCLTNIEYQTGDNLNLSPSLWNECQNPHYSVTVTRFSSAFRINNFHFVLDAYFIIIKINFEGNIVSVVGIDSFLLILFAPDESRKAENFGSYLSIFLRFLFLFYILVPFYLLN